MTKRDDDWISLGQAASRVVHKQRPVFVVRLRPEPHVKDAVYNLRAVLKIALRHFGLKCTSCTEEVRKEEDT